MVVAIDDTAAFTLTYSDLPASFTPTAAFLIVIFLKVFKTSSAFTVTRVKLFPNINSGLCEICLFICLISSF